MKSAENKPDQGVFFCNVQHLRGGKRLFSMLANISKLWAMYKPSKEIQPIVFSAILTGYLYYKIEFGGEHSAERRAAENKRRRARPVHH